jgi:hypothetical protein
MPLCCRPRRANCLGWIAGVRRSHWCFPRCLRYTGDPPTPSPKLEQGRSLPPAALTDHYHLKVGKMSSPHHPRAVGAKPIEDSVSLFKIRDTVLVFKIRAVHPKADSRRVMSSHNHRPVARGPGLRTVGIFHGISLSKVNSKNLEIPRPSIFYKNTPGLF